MSEEIQNAKVVFIGDSDSGKTSLILRFIGQEFNPDQDPTVGASYFSHILVLNNRTLRFNFWDTAGSEKYRSIATMCSKNSDAIVLVCDSSSPKAEESILKWYNSAVSDNIHLDMPIFIVVNKLDLFTQESDQIIKKIQEFADDMRILLIRTSAKDGLNVAELFLRITKTVSNCKSTLSRKSLALSSERHSKRLSDQMGKHKGCCS